MSAKVGANEKALRAQREAAAKEVERSPLEQHEDGIRLALDRGAAAFAEIGERLKAIRDERLYKAIHSSFKAYCAERWQFSERHVNRLIEGHSVLRLLAAEAEKAGPIGPGIPLPENEAQAREVAKAPPEERAEIMQQAADRTGGEPTAKAIREVVEERKPEPGKRKPNDAALAFSGRLSRLEDVAGLDPVVMAANISQQTADLCERMGRWLITVADAHRERRAA
jgi:hypothetical protein